MSKFTETKALLPSTRRAETIDEVVKGLHAFGDVYIKPLAGAQGVSIYRLSKKAPGKIFVSWHEHVHSRGAENVNEMQTNVVTRTIEESSFSSFWSMRGMKKCLVQETIPLPKTDEGRPFDFRWLIQYEAGPKIMARVARLGSVDAVTTNIHTGGEAVAAEELVKQWKPKSANAILKDLDRAALTIADRLKRLHGPYAEVGVDLGLRPNGDVVVFEVNPTPGRRMLRSLPGNVREMSLRCLIEYAIRAIGYSVGMDHGKGS